MSRRLAKQFKSNGRPQKSFKTIALETQRKKIAELEKKLKQNEQYRSHLIYLIATMMRLADKKRILVPVLDVEATMDHYVCHHCVGEKKGTDELYHVVETAEKGEEVVQNGHSTD